MQHSGKPPSVNREGNAVRALESRPRLRIPGVHTTATAGERGKDGEEATVRGLEGRASWNEEKAGA